MDEMNINLRDSSDKFYNSIAKEFNSFRLVRSNYNSYIDKVLINYIKTINLNYWLDIGCADSLRLLSLMNSIKNKPRKIIGLEPAKNLYKISTRNVVNNELIDIKNTNLESFNSVNKFSLITALWNVIGHVNNQYDFFKKVFSLLEHNGLFILDFNNRFNVYNYGLINILKNLSNEFKNKPKKGIFNFYSLNGESGKVFISSPFEVKKTLSSIGFSLIDISFINYKTGKKTPFFFQGQQLLVCKKTSE